MKAFITGITGQDGSYLAKLLLSYGYEVHGLVRRTSSDNTTRIRNMNVNIHYGDVTDSLLMLQLIHHIEPDEIYNLAAQSDVALSFSNATYTIDSIVKGTLNILEAVRTFGNKQIKIYQAGSSEMFGGLSSEAYTESSEMFPQSPYAAAKLMAHNLCSIYRNYNMFICCGILFNHTSPLRGENFVEKKIIASAVRIGLGKQNKLSLGNIYTYRDFGHACDYVVAMHKMMQHSVCDDYVISTGHSIQIKELVGNVFKTLGMDIKWVGAGINEKGYYNGRVIVDIDSRLYRPAEVKQLLGDSTKAREILGWFNIYNMVDIIDEMIAHEKLLHDCQ